MAQGWRGTNAGDEFARVAIGLVALDGVEEVLGALGLGVVEELVGRAGFHDLAIGHNPPSQRLQDFGGYLEFA